MRDDGARYDVAVVGASLAGCAAAMLLARAGLRVALVERNPDPRAYKVACTHFIQAGALPAIRSLGLDVPIERAGGVRNGIEISTRWGVIRSPEDSAFGYSIQRRTLDPMLRWFALATPGVDPLLGRTVTRLWLEHGGARVALRSLSGHETHLSARLVVGADGRDSTIARLAGLLARRRPNRRFIYWAYFEEFEPAEKTDGRFWHLDPDAAYVLPNDAGLTLVAVMPHVKRLPEFRADRRRAFGRFVAALPGGPSLEGARWASPLLGQLELPNLTRRPVLPGLALVGDAALTSDPLPGVGCGWALQSATWLAESVAGALADAAPLEPALRAYAARHRAETRGHQRLIAKLSLARPLGPAQRLLLKGAVHDERLAERTVALVQRRIHVSQYRSARSLVRAAAVATRDVAASPGYVRKGGDVAATVPDRARTGE